MQLGISEDPLKKKILYGALHLEEQKMLGLLCVSLQSRAFSEGKSKVEGKGRKEAVLQTKFLYLKISKFPMTLALCGHLGT